MGNLRVLSVAAISFFAVVSSVAEPSKPEKNEVHLSGAGKDKVVDGLTFSNTAKWDKKYLAYTMKHPRYLARDWKMKFVLPLPPANSSDRSQAELEYLKGLISKRKDHQKAIQDEVLVTNFKWGEHSYAKLTQDKKRPHTSKLILTTYEELGVVVFVFKKKFNRVRPSVLADKRGAQFSFKLGTAVEIPAHPAYPSGHATGAFTMAYILQELDPANAETYRKDALRISQNREIGGLHYPSDTEAGRLLARQIADSLLENKKYQALLEAARAEW